MIDIATRLRWTSWAGVGFVLVVLYGPFAVGRWHEYQLQTGNIFALALVGCVWIVSGVRLLRGQVDQPTALALIAACAFATAVVAAALPVQLQTGGLNWAFATFGWFVFLLSTQRPNWLVVLALALPSAVSLALLAYYQAATPAAVAALLTRACVVAGPQLILIFAASQLQHNADETAQAARRRRLLVSADEVADALDADRRRRVELVRSAIGPLLRRLSTHSWSQHDEQLHHQCLVAAARVRRLLAESHAGEDPLVHELGAGLDELQRHGLVVDLAVRGGSTTVLPVELRRGLTDPLLDVVARAASWARVTVTRTPTDVRLAVTADVPAAAVTAAQGAAPAVSAAEDVAPAVPPGVGSSLGRYGGMYWLETRCSLR